MEVGIHPLSQAGTQPATDSAEDQAPVTTSLLGSMRQARRGLPMSVPALHALPYAWLSAWTLTAPEGSQRPDFEKMRPSVGLGNYLCGQPVGKGWHCPVSHPCWFLGGECVCSDGPRLLPQLWSVQNNALLSWACPAKPALILVYMLAVHMGSVVGVAASRAGRDRV